jgi:hypothetical protein
MQMSPVTLKTQIVVLSLSLAMRVALKALLKGLKWQPLIKLYSHPVILDMLWNSGAFPGDPSEPGPFMIEAYAHMRLVDDALKRRSLA